ncbi:TIGR03773 family transporter-associated surface protein [Promicromonospora iranensis]|uniref:ABC transporter-associated repeat protein n=1 Tax=Promicromonospora iranensis TaxID=1105144 RepID=A0ABU2CK38_9MICO|nr:TIGR03773 family transporter-associated surface protein [Promicromonospora iranensis]MDR7381688.1 putative ABC transporter-associated repeat protein [Promicromonospora iranensis]
MTALAAVGALLGALVVPALSAPALAAGPTSAAVPDREYVLTHGHVDGFETTYDADTGKLVLAVRDDTRIYDGEPVFRTPESTTLAYEDPQSQVELPPAEGGWAFLGEYGGDTVWLGSQTGSDQEHAPWVGWSTERLLDSLAGTGITPASGQPVSLDVAVDGPGDVFTFQNNSFGQPINRYLDTTMSDGGTIPVAANAHVHTNWIFTAEGDYTLTVTPSLATAGGTTVTGDAATYHVRVGERPVTTAVTVSADRAEYTAGDTAVLTAAQEPATDLTDYRWEVAPTGSGESTTVEGQESAVYRRELVRGDDGARVRAVLLDGDRVAGTSEHVALSVVDVPDPTPSPTPTPTPDPTPTPTPTPTPDPTPTPSPTPTDPGTGPEPGQDREYVLDHGHADAFETTYDDDSGRLTLSVKDDTRIHADRSVYRSPEDVTLAYADPRGRVELPEATGAWSFLGEHGGRTAWLGSQTGSDQDYLPWAGWSTERLLPSLAGTGITPAAGNPVSLVVKVDGPGDVFTFQNDSFGQPVNRYIDTTSSAGGTIPVAANAHVHTNWVFTAAGDYHLEVTPRLRTADGRTITGPAADYHFRAGAERTDGPGGDGPGDGPGNDPGRPPSGAPGNDPGEGPGDAPGTDPGDTPGAGGNGPGAQPEQCEAQPVTREVTTPAVGGISSGHFDFGSMVRDGKLVAQVKDDRKQPSSWVDPATLTFKLGKAAEDEVPSGSEFAFLGTAGSTIWSVGQVQEDGVPWIGWNTQHPSLIEAADGPVTFTLDGVDGPGQLGVYATGTFGGVGAKSFGTLSGFPKSMSVPLNQHVHANWAFTEAGVYSVTLTQSVPLKSGGTASDSATLKFSVGDTSGTSTKTSYVGRTASGAECDLSAAQRAALASTGASVLQPLLLAGLLVLLGGALVVVARRRQVSA